MVGAVLDTYNRRAAGPAKAAALQTMLRDKLGPALGQAGVPNFNCGLRLIILPRARSIL